VGIFALGKAGFPLIAAAVAKNKKDKQGEYSKKDHDDRHLDCDQQYTAQREQLPKQRDGQKKESTYACDSFEKECHF
jgi:hypothetical protein